MATLLLHIDPEAPSQLLSVWAAPAAPDEAPRRWYPAVSAAEAVAGAQVESFSGMPWSRLVRRLNKILPYFVMWGSVEVEDDTDLKGLHAEYAPKVFASAASIHGQRSGRFTAIMLTPAEAAVAAATAWEEKVAVLLGGQRHRIQRKVCQSGCGSLPTMTDCSSSSRPSGRLMQTPRWPTAWPMRAIVTCGWRCRLGARHPLVRELPGSMYPSVSG